MKSTRRTEKIPEYQIDKPEVQVNSLVALMAELVEMQKEKVLQCGREFVPNLTAEDALQPNDFPVLENNPHFRYEEGILAGLQSAQTALLAHTKDKRG